MIFNNFKKKNNNKELYLFNFTFIQNVSQTERQIS